MSFEQSIEKKASWFSGLWANSLALMRKDHSLAEAALGISQMLRDGEISEAERIYKEQVLPQLHKRYSGVFFDAETDSTQLRAMIASGLYPERLCEEVQRNLK